MPLNLTGTERLTHAAVAHYWRTLAKQGKRQRKKDADRGGRAAVTGGKQMDGFCAVVEHLLVKNGMSDSDFFFKSKLELPGFFRPTKRWDLLVVHNRILVAAMEFKSQRGPSFGNNYNNRTEEAVGTSHDLSVAFRDGALGAKSPRPWVGWVMLLEDCDESNTPVGVEEPHFQVFPEFQGASYASRYELGLRKLVREGLYDAAAFLTATSVGGRRGEFAEPASDLTMRKFLASLGGHVLAYLAGK